MFFEEQDRRPPGNLRIACYYCTTSTTGATAANSDKEAVLRSFCGKLARQPDGTVARCAIDFYAKFSRESAKSPDWGDLLQRILDDSATPTILVIDALDECSKAEELLRYLADSSRSRSNLYLLCSSRPHVQVADYFHAAPAEIDTISGKSEPDMGVFIATALEERTRSPETRESIFRQPYMTSLVDDLRQALKTGADGMFRWVEIWLSILFPPNPQSQIVESDDARNLIDQIARSESLYQESSHSKLTVAYRQLWEVNSRVRHKVLQPRLFHLVLCAFNDLTLNQLTEALRIDPEGKEPYRTELQPKHIEWLCHNFLVITSTARLKWAHQSAEDFVKHHMMEGNTPVFSEASNHFCMSQIALQLISQINHPAWKDGGFDLLFWRQHESYEGQIAAWESEFPRMLEMILDVTNRVITQGSIADLNSFVEQAMLDYMHSSENIQTLAPVLEPTFFVSYVTTRFIVHLRMVCDLTASTSGLEKLLHTIIASTDSALPAIVRLLMVFPVISEKFNYFNTLSKREDKVGRNARYEMGQFFDSRRKRSSFSYYGLLGLFFHYRPMRYRSFAELKEELCTDHDVNAVIDPLKLLTVINTPDKGLIEHAVMISKSTMRAVDWINYPAKLMFLACLYNSDKTVALFLNHAFFPATRYPSSRTLLRAKGKCGELPVHFAAMYGHDRVFEVLVDSEKRRVRSFLKEKGASGEDEIATRDDDIRLLYMVDDEGKLPIHLAAACFFNIPGSERTMNLMMKYDAKYATLFPATLLHQSGAPESAVKQTSMLLMPDHSGQLPIHIASAKNAHGVRAMLQREFEAVRDHLSSDWPSSSSRNHRQRSRLLFSHSLNRKLPIDIRLGSFMQGRRDNQNWIIIQTMLEFEGKWMDLMPTETPGRKRRSELLNPKVFARIVNLWMQAHFEPEWLAWLLDRYELYSSGDLIISLIETRTLMDPLMAATATFNLRRKLLLLLKEDDSQLRLLEQLPFEPNQPSTSTLPPRTFGG